MVVNEETLNEEKLILDQPERVTTEGVIEQVVKSPLAANNLAAKNGIKPAKKKLQEQKPDAGVLLVEDPLEGVQILG